MQGPVIIKKSTSPEQAKALAESLGHVYCDELQGFLISPQDIADILDANLSHITEQLDTCVLTVTIDSDRKPKPIDIKLHGSQVDLTRLDALMKGYDRGNALLQWIFKQDRLLIQRWWHENQRTSVSVYTGLDDEECPSGRASTTLTALLESMHKHSS